MQDNKKEVLCPAQEAFKILANKWSLIIINELSEEKLRFNQLKRKAAGISARELSKRLEVMEEISAIERKVVSTKPIIIEYGLTQAGEELTSAIKAIHEWTVRNKKNIKIKPMAQESTQACEAC